MPLIIPASQTLAAGGYDISNSCRFNDDDSPYMNRTPSGAGNRKTWSFSCWYKLGNPTSKVIFGSRGDATNQLYIALESNHQLAFRNWSSGSTTGKLQTSRLFRDPNAWYHFLFVYNSTDSTATQRMRIYVNGTEETSFGSRDNPSLNFDGYANQAIEHRIGEEITGGVHLDGYLAEVHFVDGTACTPSDFGEAGDYGEWKPIAYSGSHGTNGFYLDFADSADLGDDESGEGNDFAESGLAAHDQVTDTPTNNFSTLNTNAAALNGTLSEGSLKKTGGSGHNREMSTFGFDSGKWYFEVFVETYGGSNQSIGVVTTQTGNARNNLHTGSDAGAYGYYPGGVNHGGSTNGGTYATYTAGDIIGVACDMDNLKVYFYKNGSNAITSGTAYETLVANTTYAFSCSMYNSGTQILNFGQDGTFAGNKTAAGNSDGNGYGNFFHTVPSGFLAACTKNLPDPTVTPSEHFNTILYTGTGSSNARTGVGFQSDLVWIKNRDATYGHQPYDSVRGVQKKMHTNSTTAETTDSTGLTAFGSDGFTVGSNVGVNANTQNHVAWCWKAGGSGSSNEDGSINTTSTSANVAGGFSISTYTGTGSNATVGHGLAVAPNLVIIKSRSGGEGWIVGSVQSVASMDFTDNLRLDGTTALVDEATSWNDLPPTASVVNIGTAGQSNQSSATYVMYCWHSVEGYSKVGAYTGNANRDGFFLNLGFRPKFVMIKNTAASFNWVIFDSARDVDNEVSYVLRPDISNAEYYGSDIYFAMDFCSNGIKFRENDGWFSNANTYLYIAFAETPFKYANAR